MKRVFVIHGWCGSPYKEWFPWIKKELEKKGFEVQIPEMPDYDNPKIEKGIPFLKKLVKNPDKDTYFIGHSIGCQTILRYLETLPNETKVGGCAFVSGWFHLSEETMQEEGTPEVANPWIESPINFDKILNHTTKFISIFSNDDPCVPISDSKIFKEKLNSKIIILNGRGHFNEDSNTTEIPELLKEFLKITK